MTANSIDTAVFSDPAVASLWTGTRDCTITIFGRRLSDLSDVTADALRAHLAELDDCPDCSFYLRRHPTAQPAVIVTERIKK